MKRAFFLAMAATLLCAGREPRPSYEPSFPEAPPPAPANGAIFQASNGYAPLTSGNRAAAIGDVLTIVLVERMQGTTTNGADTNRDGSLGLTPPTTGPLSFFQPSDVAMGGNNEFTGAGRSTQANSLFGEISVTVAQVLPNGNLVVRGEKSVRINRGDEYIRVAGIVRPQDIGHDNRVPSTRVADAQIAYSGRGEIARASRQGWLQRFFTIISPF
nr:flagellar basal body L-ring protein FlgH [Sphingosinicella terrae]